MSAKPFVAPDVLIDRFVRDVQFTTDFEETANLLGAPLSAQTGTDQLKIFLGEMAVSPGSAAPGAGTPIGFAGSVGAVGDMTAIPMELPVDGASVSVQALGNPGHAEPLQSEFTNAYSLL